MTPRYIGLQDTNPVAPPFHFTGMYIQVFPLRAKLDAVQQFVDAWLNFIPPECGRFRAFSPYVSLMLVDYGRMAALAANAGWCSQQEVMFTLPLEWYEVKDGKWTFKDLVWLSPFIFVDNEVSMSLGRTVWGWPKSLVQPLPLDGGVASNSTRDKVVTRLGTWVYPHLYAGADLELHGFLEVRAQGLRPAVQIPQTGTSPFALWNIGLNAIQSSFGFMTDLQRVLGQFGSRDVPFVDRGLVRGMASRMFGKGGEGVGALLNFNTVNLKQFRSACSPDQYCYQGVTVAPMRMTAFNRAGLLGEECMITGDISGGYTVEIKEWPSLPIVQTLGLDVTSHRTDGGISVATLTPVFPYWYDVDMDYNLGEVLVERSVDRVWRRPTRVDEAPAPPSPAPPSVPRSETLFNTTLGLAGQAMAGPYLFPDLSLRVLPLPARREALDAFIDGALNVPLAGTDVRFRQWIADGDRLGTVYMVACNFGPVASSTNNVGSWAEQSIQFVIPVLMEKKVGEEWVLECVGGLPTFAFTDTATAAITATEVFGAPTTSASFTNPGVGWMRREGGGSDLRQSLLSVAIKVTPAIGEGTEVVERTLLEIARPGKAELEEAAPRRELLSWCLEVANRVQVDKLRATNVGKGKEIENFRALALEPLVRKAVMRSFGIKQFRDSLDPEAACYQSLTMIPQYFEEVLEVQESDGPLQVTIDQYPAAPIVDRLGLLPWALNAADGTFRYTLTALRPFSIRGRVRQGLGSRLFWRSGTETWTPDERLQPWTPKVGPSICAALDAGDPSRLRRGYLNWRGHRATDGCEELISDREEREAIRSFSPHAAIDALLSREWGRPSGSSFWHSRLVAHRERIRTAVSHMIPAERAVGVWAEIQELMVALYERQRAQPGLETFPAVLAGVRLGELLAHLSAAAGSATRPRVEASVAAATALAQVWDKLEHFVNAPLPTAVRELATPRDAPPPGGWERLIRVALLEVEPLQERAVEALLCRLSKVGQRPDYCAYRLFAGEAADGVFPSEFCSGGWYVGPRTPTLLERPTVGADLAEAVDDNPDGREDPT